MAVRHPKEVAEAARVGGHTDLVEAAFALAERRHWTEAAALFGPIAVSSPVLAAQLLLWLYAEGRNDVLTRVNELIARRADVAGFHGLRALCLAEQGALADAEAALHQAQHLDRQDPITHLAGALVAAKKGEDIDRAVGLAAFAREGGNPGVVAHLAARVPELAGGPALEAVYAGEQFAEAPDDPMAWLVLARSRLARNDREPLRGPVGWIVARLRGLRQRPDELTAIDEVAQGLRRNPSHPVLRTELRRLTHHLRSIPWMVGALVAGVVVSVVLHTFLGGAFAIAAPIAAALVLVGLYVLARRRGAAALSPATRSWAGAVSRAPWNNRLVVADTDGAAVGWSGQCVCAQLEALVGRDATRYIEHLTVARSWAELKSAELVCGDLGVRFVALGATAPEARGVPRLAKLGG